METWVRRSRTSVRGAAIVSTFVAGPLAGLVIAIALISGYPQGDLEGAPAAMLLIWGPFTGFFYAALPAAVFGASVGQYVRRGLTRGRRDHVLRSQAIVAGASFGAIFGAALYSIGGGAASLALLLIAGIVSGAACGALVTSIVTADHRADLRAAQQGDEADEAR